MSQEYKLMENKSNSKSYSNSNNTHNTNSLSSSSLASVLSTSSQHLAYFPSDIVEKLKQTELKRFSFTTTTTTTSSTSNEEYSVPSSISSMDSFSPKRNNSGYKTTMTQTSSNNISTSPSFSPQRNNSGYKTTMTTQTESINNNIMSSPSSPSTTLTLLQLQQQIRHQRQLQLKQETFKPAAHTPIISSQSFPDYNNNMHLIQRSSTDRNITNHNRHCNTIQQNYQTRLLYCYYAHTSNTSCADCRKKLFMDPSTEIFIAFHNRRRQKKQQQQNKKQDTTTNNSSSVAYFPFAVFICVDCARAHRTLPSEVTEIKAFSNSQEKWSEQEVTIVEHYSGNDRVNGTLERYIPKNYQFRVCHLKYSNTSKITLQDREVFVRAKYETLAFTIPGLFYNDKKKKNAIKEDTESSNNNNNHGSNDRLTTQPIKLEVMPSRLIDYFCIIGSSGKLQQPPRSHHKNKKSPRRNNTNKSPTPTSELKFEPQILECYPDPNQYSDMSFPSHVSKFVFPEGIVPILRPLSTEPNFFTFVLTMDTGMRLYGACLQIYEENTSEEFLSCFERRKWMNFYVPKSLILMSHYPFMEAYHNLLLQIYHISKSPSNPIPMERYIAHITREVPLPPKGRVEVQVKLLPQLPIITLRRPARNQFPLFGFSYQPLFCSLSIGNVMTIIGCLLTETRVVLCSKHYALLTPVAEALLSLLFPFVWQGCYIPVLPYHMLDILDAPFPFLIGVHSKYLQDHSKHKPRGLVFVDLDEDCVHLGFDDNISSSSIFYHSTSTNNTTNHDDYDSSGAAENEGRRTPCLPEHEAHKLKKALRESGADNVYLPTSSMVKSNMTYGGFVLLPNDKREKYARESMCSERTLSLNPSNIIKSPSSPTTQSQSSHLAQSQHHVVTAGLTKRDRIFSKLDCAYKQQWTSMLNFGMKGDQVKYDKGLKRTTKSLHPNKSSPFHKTSTKTKNNNKTKEEQAQTQQDIASEYLCLYNGGDSTSSTKEGDTSSSSSPSEHYNCDETDKFSAMGIRSAFLRFFVSIFLSFQKYIDTETASFDQRAFLHNGLNSSYYSTQTKQTFISLIIQSQMFERFVQENVLNPTQPEVLFFNESIAAKKNRSRTKSFKTGKRLTPFLQDESDQIKQTYKPLSPNMAGLSTNDSTTGDSNTVASRKGFYMYDRFPNKLDRKLIGKNSHYNNNSSSSYHNNDYSSHSSSQPMDKQRLISLMPSASLKQNSALSSVVWGSDSARNMSKEYVLCGKRDLDWAYQALAFKCFEEEDDDSDDHPDFHNIQNMNNIYNNIHKNPTNTNDNDMTNTNTKNKSFYSDVLLHAQKIIQDARTFQMWKLNQIAKLQCHYRMSRIRNDYRNFKKQIIKLQIIQRVYFRKKHFRNFEIVCFLQCNSNCIQKENAGGGGEGGSNTKVEDEDDEDHNSQCRCLEKEESYEVVPYDL